VQQWQYGLAVYTSKANQREMIDFRSSDLGMNDVEESKGISLTTFLKAAGECGWELSSVLYPFAPGQVLGKDIDGENSIDFTIEDRHETQWLLFKRPKR
jgi:hypothetical protein